MSSTLVASSSTTVATQNDPQRPTHLQPPTDRDLEIYKQVKICRIPQFEVAADNDLHYSRVSQIVKEVHHWLIAGGQPTDPELRDHAARQRLSRAAHQLRLLRCLELATDAMEAHPLPLETTKRRLVHGREMWCEETKRDQPHPRLAAVRVVLRTTEALHKLEQTQQQGGEPQPAADQDLLPAIFDLLCTLRIRAQADGLLKNTADGRLQNTSDVTSIVAATLNNLLGTDLEARGREPIAVPPEPSEQSNPARDSRDHRPCARGALTGQLHNTHARLLPLDTPTQPTATEPSSASTPLNLSADPQDPNTTTLGANSPCADSIAPAATKNPQLERRATPGYSAASAYSITPPIPISDPPPTPLATSYTQLLHPPP